MSVKQVSDGSGKNRKNRIFTVKILQKDIAEPAAPSIPNFDPKLLQALAGLSRQGGIDANQQALLKALSPYLSRDRVNKLERAMGAARMAGAASAFLSAGGLQILSGR